MQHEVADSRLASDKTAVDPSPLVLNRTSVHGTFDARVITLPHRARYWRTRHVLRSLEGSGHAHGLTLGPVLPDGLDVVERDAYIPSS